MRNGLKGLIIALSVVVVIALGFLIRNRYSFGVWNPFSLPDRIQCYNRRYYKSAYSPKILNENEKPKYPIKFSDNRTGKELFISDPKGEYVPTVIYLKVDNDRYQTYHLSGGP